MSLPVSESCLLGLADSSAFDEQVIKLALRSQVIDALHEIFSQSAANAAVLHLDQLLLSLHPHENVLTW